MDYSNWIVETIPGLHPTYANLDPNGYWTYWEKVDEGWKWNPKWVEVEPEKAPATPVKEDKEERKMPALLYKKKEGVEIVGLHRSSSNDVWVGQLQFSV